MQFEIQQGLVWYSEGLEKLRATVPQHCFHRLEWAAAVTSNFLSDVAQHLPHLRTVDLICEYIREIDLKSVANIADRCPHILDDFLLLPLNFVFNSDVCLAWLIF